MPVGQHLGAAGGHYCCAVCDYVGVLLAASGGFVCGHLLHTDDHVNGVLVHLLVQVVYFSCQALYILGRGALRLTRQRSRGYKLTDKRAGKGGVPLLVCGLDLEETCLKPSHLLTRGG